MKLFPPFAIFLLITSTSFAQNTRDIYRIKEGTDIAKSFPYSDKFQFEEFRDGMVYFRNGRTSKAKLNYSMVHGEVLFISAQKDTLLLTENDFIERIQMGPEVFYYMKNHGHLRQKAAFDKVALVEKLFLAVKGNEKYAAYDQYSESSAISSYSSYTNANGVKQTLEGSGKVLLKKQSMYFLMDRNKRFSPANKASLLRIFPSHKKNIMAYVKDQSIDFDSEADLVKVLAYSNSL